MKSLRYYSLLAFALSLPIGAYAADFGDIPASLALPAGTSVRRNAGNTGFESFTPGSGSGNVISSGTPLLDQIAVWTDATHIKGVTTIKGGTTGQVLTKSSSTDYAYVWADASSGGTPGGSNTQAQYNNSGVFGGIPSITYDGSTTFLVSPVISGDAMQGVVLNNGGGYGSLVAQSTAINTGLTWAFLPHDTAPSVRPTNVGFYSASDTGNSNLLSISSKGTGDNYNLIASYATGTATIAPIGIEANSSLGATPQLVIGTDGGVSVGTGTQAGSTNLLVAGTITGRIQRSVTFVVDGAGGVLTTGTKNPIKIPYGGTLTGWLLIGKPSGSVTVDIFRAADGAGLPVTSIVGGGTKPALSSAVEASSTSFTSWTSTSLTAKDNLAISLSGVSTSTYCALTLYYQ